MHKLSLLAGSALVLMFCALFAFTASAQVYPIGNTSNDDNVLNDDNTSLQNNSTMDDMTNGSTSSSTSTPGVPNTGVGGDSAGTWLMLILSGILAVGGIGYMVTVPRS